MQLYIYIYSLFVDSNAVVIVGYIEVPLEMYISVPHLRPRAGLNQIEFLNKY